MVAEKSNHLPAAHANTQRRVEFVRIGRHAGAVAAKSRAQRVPEHAFVGGKPLESEFGCDRQRFLGNRPFRRPQSVRRFPEHSLVVAARAHELLAGVFRMAKRGHGQRGSHVGHARDVGIAQQRKDGVIERRGRNFNLPGGSGSPVFGQHAPQKFDLFLAKLLLVLLGKVNSLSWPGATPPDRWRDIPHPSRPVARALEGRASRALRKIE